MKLNRIAALAALAIALAPAARLDAQAAGGSPPAHAHAGHHEQHAPAAAGAHRHGEHAAGKAGCAHGGGEHAPTPAMLVGHHRADLALTDAQVQRLQALRQDDAAGAREVLTAEQRAKLDGMHAAMAATRGGGAHAHGADCCKDGRCCEEGCCKDGKCCGGDAGQADCCRDGRCTAECRERCQRMGAAAGAAKDGRAPPRS
ncbi:MAG TPA: hypothetical protein VHG51_16690 [Longimicrobiaceae bacterium]|nr:hypothetical protein [Longimicrobiaceae bacterium]